MVTKRLLRTPLGRERVFHGLRPYGDNGKVFREGYAYIPQSTIGDNNGLAVLFCQTTKPDCVLGDGHDSMLTEVDDDVGSVIEQMKLLLQAYDRIIRFPNGFEVRIPIDFKLGYTLKEMKKCLAPLDARGLTSIQTAYQQLQSLRLNTTSGAELAVSPQPSNEAFGSENQPGGCSQISL